MADIKVNDFWHKTMCIGVDWNASTQISIPKDFIFDAEKHD
jgi:hypothetical protein